MADYDTPVVSPDVIGFPGTREQIQNMLDPSNIQTSTVDQVLRNLRIRQMGVSGAGDLFVNFLLEDGLTYGSIHEYADRAVGAGGILGLLTEQIPLDQGGKGQLMEPWDLTLVDGRDAFMEHLLASWKTIPELKERLRIAYKGTAEDEGAFLGDQDDVTSEVLETWLDTAHGISPGEIEGAATQAPPKRAPAEEPVAPQAKTDATSALETSLGFQLNEEFGGEAADLFAGASDAEAEALFTQIAEQFIDEIALQSRYVVAEKNPTGDRAQTFVLSYDGTAQGEVNTVLDLFSNGQLGVMDWATYLPDLQRRTAEGGQSSTTIMKLQQEMYATGYLTSRPETWGQLSRHGLDPLIRAMGDFQLDVIAEAARLGSGLTGREQMDAIAGLDPRLVMDSMLEGQYGEQVHSLDERARQESIAEEVKTMATQMINDRGRNVSASGQKLLTDTLNKVLGEVDSATAERLWGEGGSQEELALANAVLTEYYGVDDWENNITFGHKDSDRSAAKYARKVGAISHEEFAGLQMHKSVGPNAPLHRRLRDPKVGKDIATSHFLRELGQELAEGQSLADATADQIQGALMGYSHTLGLRSQGKNEYVPDDFFGMATRAQSRIPLLSMPDPALGELTEDVMNRLGITESVAGTGFDSYLRNINPGGRRITHSRIPNA